MEFSVEKWLKSPFARKQNFHEKGHKINKNRFSCSNFSFLVTCISYGINSSIKWEKFPNFRCLGVPLKVAKLKYNPFLPILRL